MKQIENVKWYHTSNFHQKHFTINFTGSTLQIRDKETDNEFKFINLCVIRSCNVIEREFETDYPGKRSQSVTTKSKGSKCPWLFEFRLETTDRSFNLFAPTRLDRDHWVKIFSILVDMNKASVSTKEINPFEFDSKRNKELQV